CFLWQGVGPLQRIYLGTLSRSRKSNLGRSKWGSFPEFAPTSGHPSLVFEQLEIPASDPTETFRQPIVDSRGWIWVPGTDGLARFKNGQWTRYTAQNGLLSNSTWGVTEAADGAIWVIYSEPLGVTRLNLAV